MLSADIIGGYEIRKFGIEDYVSKFDCGDEDLNDFNINDAPLYRKAMLAVTYIL